MVYDLKERVWAPLECTGAPIKGVFPQGIAWHSAVLLSNGDGQRVGGRILLLGGQTGGRVQSEAWVLEIFDAPSVGLRMGHWSRLHTTGDVPPPRLCASTALLPQGVLMLVGGASPEPRQLIKSPDGTGFDVDGNRIGGMNREQDEELHFSLSIDRLVVLIAFLFAGH